MTTQAQAVHTTWEFTLTREPVNVGEQASFAADLAQLHLDEIAWLILNGTVETGTRYSIPKVLRGYLGGKLAGVAYMTECRRYGQSLFGETRLASLLDAAPMPISIWMRHGAITDALSNPGFVAEGVQRNEFVAQAMIFLRRSYLMGAILESDDPATGGVYASFPFCDYGVVDLRGKHSVNDLYLDSKNLKRKVSKFRNKGGEIEVIYGKLSQELCDAAIRCMNSLKPLILTPFQDNYNNMVLRASAHANDRILHFVARMEDECIGYHSFAWSGNSLYCLSGAFDRTRHSNYHAYENLILASADFCLEQGLSMIHYGPVMNATKAKMMSHFVPVEQRFFARFDQAQQLVRWFMAKTKLAATDVASYANLGGSSHTLEHT